MFRASVLTVKLRHFSAFQVYLSWINKIGPFFTSSAWIGKARILGLAKRFSLSLQVVSLQSLGVSQWLEVFHDTDLSKKDHFSFLRIFLEGSF